MTATLAPAPGLLRLFTALHGLEPVEPERHDPAAGLAEAHERGFAESRAAATAELAPLRAALAEAAAALTEASRIDPETLRPLFADLTRRLCGAALAAELRLTPHALAALVDAALAAAGGRGARLRLNPETLRRLALPPLAVPVEADATLAPDAVAVDGPAFALEASVTARLAAVLEGLGG